MSNNQDYIMYMTLSHRMQIVPIKTQSTSDQMMHMLVKANVVGCKLADYYRECSGDISEMLANDKLSMHIFAHPVFASERKNIQVGWRYNANNSKVEVYMREMHPQSCEILCNYSIWLDPAELLKDKL